MQRVFYPGLKETALSLALLQNADTGDFLKMLAKRFLPENCVSCYNKNENMLEF